MEDLSQTEPPQPVAQVMPSAHRLPQPRRVAETPSPAHEPPRSEPLTTQPPGMLRGLLHRAAVVLATLTAIAYLTQFGLILAERGRQGLPAEFFSAAREALAALLAYIVAHPWIYVWHRTDEWAFALVAKTFANSAGLLLLALGIAVALGVPLGLAAALSRGRSGAVIAVLVSVVGISTPSFLLAMLFWVADIVVYRSFNVRLFPTSGFGWDAHMVLPTLVLAARPLAQVAQITHISLAEVLSSDYIRTARSKGLTSSLVVFRHAFRNVWVPVLTTLGTSLRFSLASLPVVELFFDWPGVGSTLLEAIQLGNASLVTDLIVSLGLFFVVVNQGLEWALPWLYPPLRQAAGDWALRQRDSMLGLVRDGLGELGDRLDSLRERLRGGRRPVPRPSQAAWSPDWPPEEAATDPLPPHRRRWLRLVLLNPMLSARRRTGRVPGAHGHQWATLDPGQRLPTSRRDDDRGQDWCAALPALIGFPMGHR